MADYPEQPVRGRARGRARVRTTPQDFSPPSMDQMKLADVELRSDESFGLDSVSVAPSGLSESLPSVGDVFDDLNASSVGAGSSRPGSSVANLAGSSRELDTLSVCSASSGDQKKGQRITIKPGFSKAGSGGEEFFAMTNYLHVNKTPNFELKQYRVDFNPDETSTLLKKLLVRAHEQELGAYIFDGHMLYSNKVIPLEKRKLMSTHHQDGKVNFEITIRHVGLVLQDSPMYLQFYNMVMRKAMSLIDMEELGRHYFNRHAAINFPEEKLDLWPGIITAIRNHDAGILVCLEVTHKVLRTSSVLDTINALKNRSTSQEEFETAVRAELIGTIVITHYNRRTYKVDEIDFKSSPISTFRQADGSATSYADYFLRRYNVEITDMTQPMLVSYPKKKDADKGLTGNMFLVPALCNPTGLTDTMRKNFPLMKKLSEHLHMGPSRREEKLSQFVDKLKCSPAVQQEFKNWDIDFDPNFIVAKVRKYPAENVYMGPQGSPPTIENNADWTRSLKGRGMLVPVNLIDWILFVPIQDSQPSKNLINELKIAGRAINVVVNDPNKTVTYRSANALPNLIRDELRTSGADVKFAFVVLPNNNLKTYTSVKRICTLDYGIGCQCLLAKNMNRSDPKSKQKLGSICTKIMIQITAKQAGVPWGVRIPISKLMVLGFDVYHCSERKGESVGALVSTLDQALHRYHSSVAFHKDKSELAQNLTAGMKTSLQAYRIQNNGALPDRIILFRDGVGDGQINFVLDYEIPRLKLGIEEFYNDNHQIPAKLAVIIVTKKINSRVLLARKGVPLIYDNVPPGTVVDNTFTLPERYDYFLVSQAVNQGTVSPTNYNVIHDEIEWAAEKMHRLSFKLCHLYYNWCGTVAVPAPCQYAHKLAYLTGVSVNAEAPQTLANSLWYL